MCIFEMYCEFFNTTRESAILLVKSSTQAPVWISSSSCTRLCMSSVSPFPCCSSSCEKLCKDTSKCLRTLVRDAMSQMIQNKAIVLFEEERITEARYTIMLEKWWLQGLTKSRNHHLDSIMSNTTTVVDAFKAKLRWNEPEDELWIDRTGVSVLFYAVVNSNVDVVRETLRLLNEEKAKTNDMFSALVFHHILNLCIAETIPSMGFVSGQTPLHVAMAMGPVEIVTMLLREGADPDLTDLHGHDSFMMACIFGRTDTMDYWLQKIPHWNVDSKNKYVRMLLSRLYNTKTTHNNNNNNNT